MPPRPCTVGFRDARLRLVDIAIVVFYLGLSVAIGLLANRFVTGLAGYLVAGRSLGTALSIATMTGSELGLITVMYQAQKGFTGGFAALHIGLIAGIVTLFVGLTGFIVVGLRRTGVMTIPEYYARRFGKDVRITGGILLALGGILNMGLFLQVGSQFVVGVTGLDPSGDTIALVMTGAPRVSCSSTPCSAAWSPWCSRTTCSSSCSRSGSSRSSCSRSRTSATTTSPRSGRRSAARRTFDPSEQFGGAYITWMGVLGLVSCAIWPTAVTRALSARDETVVKRQYIVLGDLVHGPLPAALLPRASRPTSSSPRPAPIVTQDASSFTFEGARARQHHGAADLHAEMLPVGVLGLLTAAMLAAFMSTHDSYLLCWASVIARDILAPLSAEGGHARAPAPLDTHRHRADRRLRPRVGHLLQAEPGRLGLPRHHRRDLLHRRDRRADGRPLLEAGEPHGRALGALRRPLGRRRAWGP